MDSDDPVITPTMMMAVAGASGALAAGGSVIGGIQAQKAGQAAQQQANTEAAAEQQQAGAQINQTATEGAQTLSRVRAGAGAAGLTAGSAQPILSEDVAQSKIKEAYSRFSGNLASTESVYSGRLARNQGNQALAAGVIQGVGNILGAASNIGRIKNPAWGVGTT